MPRKKPISERLITHWRTKWLVDIDRPLDRCIAWFDMLIIDHGLIRMIYNNRHAIGPDVERSNHPTPGQLTAAAKRGVKTIVNLRGDNLNGSYLLEKRACNKLGITIINYRMKSRQLPTRDKVLGIKTLFHTIEHPVLIHCKSGADRAGLVAALYAIFHLHTPAKQAKKQHLAIRYGHIRTAKTGVLDYLFDAFLQSNTSSFTQWITDEYDPDTLGKAFRPNGWVAWAVDKILRRE